MNLVDSVIDEVALEGLDGITLEALWDRMVLRLHEKAPLPQPLTEQIWNICLHLRDISFYELEKERDKLVIYDRYEFVDPDLGIILENDDVPNDIYEHCAIDDRKNGIRGSCATYYTRKDISGTVKNLSVRQAENIYGRKLVIVASQEARQNALIDKSACPTVDLNTMPYCFLERVGRSRYHGELTQGKLSLSSLKEDPKSLFYHRKILLRHRLITKQAHHQKSCWPSLLHLPRFYVERKPKVILLVEKVIDFLKSRPNHMAGFIEMKRELKIESSIKKLLKTAFFQKAFFQNAMRTDLVVPARTLYPHAPPSQWQYKNNPGKERMLRVIQLIDPNVDINDLWKNEFANEDEDPYELDISQQQYCVPFFTQANRFVEASKDDGISLSELARRMGVPQLHARTIFRNLAKLNIVATYMQDIGRQRVTKYVSRKFDSGSRMNKQLELEMSKMKKLTEAPIEKTCPNNDKVTCADPSKLKVEKEKKSFALEKCGNDKSSKPLDPSKDENSRLFNAATMILRKYKLTGWKRSYRRTFCNVADMRDIGVQSKRRKLMRVGENDEAASSDAKFNIDETPVMRELKEKLLVSEAAERRTSDVVSLKDFASTDLKNVSNVSYRLLKRANIIIGAINEHKIIDDVIKLMKMITEEEEKEGCYVKIDKKSMIRLLQRLAKDNLVKNIKLTLSTGKKDKSMTFICHPSIDVNHAVIRSAVEQAKLKCCLVETQPPKTLLQSNELRSEVPNESGEKLEAVDQSKGNVKPVKKGPTFGLVHDKKAGVRYGYAPKYARLQALHGYLFYIIYEHPGKPRESQKQLIDALRSKDVPIDEKLEKDMSDIFNTEIGWKMFVPPLPKHDGWPRGWALMCDLLLCMPLSLFLKLHKVSYVMPELDERLKDPIRKHLLVKDTPASMRNVLLMRRQYIYDVHKMATRLCYMGLLQFGPQKLQEKDKVFVYLNRRTELMDTTSSAADYHKIEAKIYPVIRYKLTTLKSVDEYWYKLWKICVNTRLGGRLVVQGKEIVLEDLTKKIEMIEATQPRTPEEAYRMDNGHVPGDRMGAAGIDSAFFAHLKRSWNAESANYPFKRLTGDHNEAPFVDKCDVSVARMKSRPVRFVDLNDIKKRAKPPVTDEAIDSEKTQAKNSNVGNASWKSKNPRAATSVKGGRTNNKPRSYVRRILPSMGHPRARVKYDEIDHSALQRMNKLRVDWDTREDNILLVCKVAMMYLCPQPRRQMIGFASVRDVLRSYSLTSYNKTSRACQRRLLYMLKTPETHHSVNLGVEELKQDFYINRRFGDTLENLKRDYRGTHKYNEQLNLVFRDLVTHIAKKYYDITDIQASTLNFMPTTCEEFRLFHRVKYPKRVTGLQAFDDATTNDIHASTINSVIHSSMCCVKDRRSWAYQLFRIYQQYPEWLLRSAMAKIRADQMVTIKKNYAFAIRKQTNTCMPMSSSQYQLSSAYVQKFNTKLPFGVFKEAWDFFVQLARNYSENYSTNGVNVKSEEKKCAMMNTPVNGGTIAAIHDYVNIAGLNFDVEIPRHIIMLDPTLQKDDERYVRIARRYQDILRNLEHVDIDDILNNECNQEARNDRTDHVAPSTSSRSIEDSCRAIDKSASKNSSFDKPKDTSLENDADPRKFRQVARTHDSHEANTDTEAIESEHETNFDDDDCYDEIDENDWEDDDLICFIDGTKIRLTREDIENSGYTVNPQNDDSVTSRENKRARELSSDKKVEDNQLLEDFAGATNKFKQDITECEMDDNAEMEPELYRNRDNPQPEESQCGDVRVNELIERTNFAQFDNPTYHRTGETYDVQKRYTRLAMLQMREELHDLASSDSHHAHEYFVLNMFKVFHSLRRETIKRPLDLTTFQGLQLPNELLPLNRDRYSAIIDDLKKFAIFPKTTLSYERFKKNLRATDVFKRGSDAVYEFIRDKREVGASLSQLSTKFYGILGEQLFDILSALKEERMVLRSGVTNTRYIHQKYAEPWLIHSYKIMRLQKEAQPVIQPGSLYVVSRARTKDRNERKRKSITKGMRKAKETTESLGSNEGMNVAEIKEEGERKESGDPPPGDSETGKTNQGKMQKSRTCLLPTKDIYRAAKQLDLDTAEEIRVVVRPWIRIDGALNRRVLDRMLGAVLAYCLIHPGAHLMKIEEKFTPAIQPFHTKELVEILMRLECLKMGCTRKSRVTLFSNPSPARSVFSCVPERCKWSEEELIVEPMVDATLKFSTFLSTRTYTSDFLA